jgi:hypothetical protein
MRILQGWGLLLLAMMPLAADPVAAAEPTIDYQLGLSAGQRSIDYDSKSIASGTVWADESGNLRPGLTGGSVKLKFSEPLYTAAINGAAVYKDSYLAFSVEWPISTEDTGLRVIADPIQGPGFPLGVDSTTDYELDRIDYSITLGHRIWKGLSFFAGYKYTEFKLNAKGPNILLEEVDSKSTEEGFFLGGSYAFRIANAGTLSLSVGYAYLDLDFSQSNISSTAPSFAFAIQEYAYTGSSTGLSYGVQWTGEISGPWAYTLSLKYQEYSSKNDATSQGMLLGENFPPGDPNAPYTSTNIQHTKISSDHSDTTGLVGVMYRF